MSLSKIRLLHLWVAFDVVGRVLDQRRALGEHRDPFRQREDDVHVMLDDAHGDISFLVDLFEQIDGVVGVGPRHARRRLVEQQELGRLHEAHRHLEPPFVPA